MEEEKKVHAPQGLDGQGGQNGQGGRKRRRHKKKGGNGGQGNAQNAQNPQSQGAQNNAQGGQGNAQPQKNAQNGQKSPQGGNAQNGQKQKGQQKGQNQPNPSNQPKQKGQNQPQQKQKGQPAQQQNAQKNQQKGQKQETRKDTYVYMLDGNLYVNLTNKCSNGCDFCVRNERASYFGHYLWLNHGDPTYEKVVSACNGMGDLTRFKEVVFCGFGEPTYRMDVMLPLCDYFHGKGLSTRLNTNGQGCLINKRDIVPEMKGKLDKVNISLNASNAESYQKICRSQYGENGFGAMIEFAKACKRAGIECRFSIVDVIGEIEVEACKKLAASVNVPLYIRPYISDC